MTTAYARRWAKTAQAATARAHELAEGWEHAAPRRPMHGHTADCPKRACPRCYAPTTTPEEHCT